MKNELSIIYGLKLQKDYGLQMYDNSNKSSAIWGYIPFNQPIFIPAGWLLLIG